MTAWSLLQKHPLPARGRRAFAVFVGPDLVMITIMGSSIATEQLRPATHAQ